MSIRRYERMVCLALGFCLLAALACVGGSAAENQSPEAKGSTELVELRIELPPPAFLSSMGNLKSDILDPETGKCRKPLMVPKGLSSIAEGKPVSASSDPVTGELGMITDGIKRDDREEPDKNIVEIMPGLQWVQVDFGAEHEVFAVILWHIHRVPEIYRDIVVQLSNDSKFQEGVTTIYNNDQDNSAGLGAGKDWEWIETNEGRLMDARGAKGRYLRCYSNGNAKNSLNHYLEVEVHGRPAKP